MEETQSHSLNHISTLQASSASNPDGTSTSSTLEGLLRIPSNLIPSLKKIIIEFCGELTFQGDKDGFSGFTSLEELTIQECPSPQAHHVFGAQIRKQRPAKRKVASPAFTCRT